MKYYDIFLFQLWCTYATESTATESTSTATESIKWHIFIYLFFFLLMFINLFIYYRIQIIYVCISLQVTVYYIYIYVCMQDVVLIFKYFYYSNCIYKTYYFPLLCTCLYGYIYLRMEILRRCHSFFLLLLVVAVHCTIIT